MKTENKLFMFKRPLIRKRNKKKYKLSDIKYCRTGHTPLININEFKKNYNKFVDQIEDKLKIQIDNKPSKNENINNLLTRGNVLTSTEQIDVKNNNFDVKECLIPSIYDGIEKQISFLSKHILDDEDNDDTNQNIKIKKNILINKAHHSKITEFNVFKDCLKKLKEKRKQSMSNTNKNELNISKNYLSKEQREKNIKNLQNENKKCINKQLSKDEVILNISFYDIKDSKTFKSKEFLFYGSQPLISLVNSLGCTGNKCKQLKGNNGYLFIENIFFDIINKNNGEVYSKVIREWIGKNKRFLFEGLETYESYNIEGKKINDIKFRIGSHYFYCHRGNCRHVIIVDKIRIKNENDYNDSNCYPVLIYKVKKRMSKCNSCEIFIGKYKIYNNEFLDKTPYIFCESCFNMFDFGNKSEKLDVSEIETE